jgi:citrate synthase
VGEAVPITTSIATIQDGQLVYRGRDACCLARSHSALEVARGLWTGSFSARDEKEGGLTLPPDVSLMAPLLSGLSPLARMQSLLPIVQDGDSRAFDLSMNGLIRSARLILLTLATAVSTADDEPKSADIGHVLCSRWGHTSPAAYRSLQAALIVAMAHPPNVDALAARSAATLNASLHDATLAGLSAFRGTRATGEIHRVDALLREAGEAHSLAQTIADRQARGDHIPGFGHSAFPDGDPRARLIHQMIRTHFGGTDGAAFTVAAEQVGREYLGQPPNLSFAMVALARALHLPRNAATALFAVARSVHWIAQAIEAIHADDSLTVEPTYTGPPPTTSADDGPKRPVVRS